jgi:hypothetical protein
MNWTAFFFPFRLDQGRREVGDQFTCTRCRLTFYLPIQDPSNRRVLNMTGYTIKEGREINWSRPTNQEAALAVTRGTDHKRPCKNCFTGSGISRSAPRSRDFSRTRAPLVTTIQKEVAAASDLQLNQNYSSARKRGLKSETESNFLKKFI